MTEYLVTVKPGTSQEKIVEGAPGELTVYLRAKPHDGEANTALTRMLADYFDMPKTSIIIKRGAKSKNKVIEI